MHGNLKCLIVSQSQSRTCYGPLQLEVECGCKCSHHCGLQVAHPEQIAGHVALPQCADAVAKACALALAISNVSHVPCTCSTEDLALSAVPSGDA